MPRATTKVELLAAANTQWKQMWLLIDSLSEEEQTASFTFDTSGEKEAHWKRDKNLRDVLIHLYEWHQLLLIWVSANTRGDRKPFLPEPYNWKTYGDMNVSFWEQHQSTAYEDAKALLHESHAKVMTLIERFSDEELFEKKYFSWTGTTNLGSYCISATSSHYDWAIKKIKRHSKDSKAKRAGHFVYIACCSDGSLYTGWTTDLDERIKAHNSGQGAKYTRSRLPVSLAYSEQAETKSDALKREREIKLLDRSGKLSLIETHRAKP